MSLAGSGPWGHKRVGHHLVDLNKDNNSKPQETFRELFSMVRMVFLGNLVAVAEWTEQGEAQNCENNLELL